MNRILITGASGFIGRALVSCLKSKGGLYIRTLGKTKAEGVENIFCDFLKEDMPKKAFKDIDTVFHLAGYAHDLTNQSNNVYKYKKLNVDVTNDLLSLSVDSGVKSFVFVSSVKAGGSNSIGKCLTEEDQTNPNEIYGKTKRTAELKVLEVGRSSKMHVSILRPSLVYGPEVKGNLSLMLNAIRSNWFPPPPNVSNIKSMIHVDDVVEAIQFIALKKSANMGIFIATDGYNYSISEIYKILCYESGKVPHRWRTPMILFRIISLLSPSIKQKIDKLLRNECYSSDKLKLLGFKSKKSLANINETNF